MAITEPPPPMAKPTNRNTSSTTWEMLPKGTVVMMLKIPLSIMALVMSP